MATPTGLHLVQQDIDCSREEDGSDGDEHCERTVSRIMPACRWGIGATWHTNL